MSRVLVCVLCFWFFLFDAQQWLRGFFTKSSSPDVFLVLFISGGTPMKIVPLKKNFGAQNVHFLEQQFLLSIFGRLLGNKEVFWQT